MKNMLKNKYVWLAVVLGVIAGNIVGVIVFKDKGDTGTVISVDAETVIASSSTSPFFVRVSDQPAGPTVVVSEVRSSATSTWLAVREQNGDLLGQIIGARRIDAPSATGVSVELLRSTVPSLMYAVVMYEDDGNGMFEYATDTLVKVDGVTLSYPFVAK